MAGGLWSDLKLSPLLRNMDGRSEERYSLIVELFGNAWDKVAGFVESQQGTVFREIKLIPAMEIDVPLSAVSELARLPSVRRVWSNTAVEPLASTVNRMAVPWLRREKATGKGVTVALLDTGIRQWPGFGRWDKSLIGWADMINGRSVPYDEHGHGTYLARIIAEQAPDARLIGVKVLNRKATGTLADVLLGIEWCLGSQSDPVQVMAVPLKTLAQGDDERDLLCRALARVAKNGILVCTGLESGEHDRSMAVSPGMHRRLLVVVDSEWPVERGAGRIVAPDPDHPFFDGKTAEIGAAVGYLSGIAACILEEQPFASSEWLKRAIAKRLWVKNASKVDGRKSPESELSELVRKQMQAIIDQVITYLSQIDLDKLLRRMEFYQNPQVNEWFKLGIALMKALKLNEAMENMLRNSMIPELIRTGLTLLQETIEKTESDAEGMSSADKNLNPERLWEAVVSGIRAAGGGLNSELQEMGTKLIRALIPPEPASE